MRLSFEQPPAFALCIPMPVRHPQSTIPPVQLGTLEESLVWQPMGPVPPAGLASAESLLQPPQLSPFQNRQSNSGTASSQQRSEIKSWAAQMRWVVHDIISAGNAVSPYCDIRTAHSSALR